MTGSAARRDISEEALTDLKALSQVSARACAIAEEAAAHAGRALGSCADALERMLAADGADDALAIQLDAGRQAWTALVSGTARLNELYAELVRDAYKVGEAAVMPRRRPG